MNMTQSTLKLAERYAATYTGAVFDVMRAKGHRDCVLPSDIVALDRDRKMAGPVFTMRGRQAHGTDAHQTLLAWTGFLDRAPAGHVVVCEGGQADCALMGELSAETLHMRGVAGYLTDGGCRDADFIRRIGFPVFSRFLTPRDVVGAWLPESYETDITIGGIAIRSGDYLVADRDGAVIVPASLVTEVLEEVERVMNTENLVRKAILSGVSPTEAYLTYGKF
jgi:regulator of RNase E activity RraA